MTKRKRSTRTFTQIEFGFHDGRVDTVKLLLDGSSVTLEGELLQKVSTAYFSLKGYGVSPGLKSLGLTKGSASMRRGSDSDGNYVIKDMNMRDGMKGPLHMALSLSGGYLRLWIQSTTHPNLYFNIFFSQDDEKDFGRRLAQADGWDIDG